MPRTLLLISGGGGTKSPEVVMSQSASGVGTLSENQVRVDLRGELINRLESGSGHSTSGKSIERSYSTILDAWRSEWEGDAQSEFALKNLKMTKTEMANLFTDALGTQLQDLLAYAAKNQTVRRIGGGLFIDHLFPNELMSVNEAMPTLICASDLAAATDSCETTRKALVECLPIVDFLSGLEQTTANRTALEELHKTMASHASLLDELCPKDLDHFCNSFLDNTTAEDFVKTDAGIWVKDVDSLRHRHSGDMPIVTSNLSAFAKQLTAKAARPVDTEVLAALGRLEGEDALTNAFKTFEDFKREVFIQYFEEPKSAEALQTASSGEVTRPKGKAATLRSRAKKNGNSSSGEAGQSSVFAFKFGRDPKGVHEASSILDKLKGLEGSDSTIYDPLMGLDRTALPTESVGDMLASGHGRNTEGTNRRQRGESSK